MFAESSLSNRDAVPGWSDWSNEKRVWVVVGIVAAVAAVLVVLKFVADVCGGSDGGCSS